MVILSKNRERLQKNSKLTFEGEYLNGKKWNGKGKIYNNGKLAIEVEYLNGKIWNGKGYNKRGIKKFEINNGKGYIKEYDYYIGILIFEGEYLNGERNGKGKEYYKNDNLFYAFDNLYFEGEYLNGKRNGKGKEYYYDGKLKFDGE